MAASSFRALRRLVLIIAWRSRGKPMAIIRPAITITTSVSIRVKPLRFVMRCLPIDRCERDWFGPW